LGLPIARRLARAMGGDVWYERRFPTGSRFCFSMPTKALVEEEAPLVHQPVASSQQAVASSQQAAASSQSQ
ncbi:MAG TPA: hypothetical protein VLA54_11975, partial [Acidimicrobiia bacterium]|nr:hypothetical protein [Acidimicrobiia bacterium]